MGEGARLLHGWEGEYEMTARTVTLAEINNGGAAQFVDVLGDVFENSPWLVERAAAARPYSTRDELVAKLLDVMNTAGQDEQLALIPSLTDHDRCAHFRCPMDIIFHG
jgi:2-oxo-4-hydroxy-4-carboxy--5-ureidoimidazoline (OHCU) decarboxylase